MVGLLNPDATPDFACYPELRWLDRFYLVPFFVGAGLLFGAGATIARRIARCSPR